MPTPPTYQKVNPADQPVIYLALSSPTLPLYTVDEYAQTNLAQRISTISGVAQVIVFGSQKYAVRVQVDPRALAARGIGIDEVEQAIVRGNVNKPTGTLYGPQQAVNVQATGQLMDAAAYRPLIVAYRNGSPVRLEEIGRVIDGVETDKVASWFNDERAVVLAVQRQPGTNTIEVVDAIRALLPSFRQQLPASVNLNVVYDRSVAIRESVHDVQFTLLLTIALVVMVIFLFLRNVSATIIPSLAVPLSIIGTFAVMYVLGYTIDIISLMALTLCVGFVVDDAVVMLENIVRHMEAGEGRMEAALRGAREIGFTILSMTISLAAVFIPVLFMGGVVGRLLHEFAVVIGAAVLVSGLVSLTLTPMLCSRFLRPPHAGGGSRLYQRLRAVLRRHAARLRPVAVVDAPPSPHDHGGARRHLRPHRLPLRADPEGLHPERGQRLDPRLHRGRPGHLLRGDDGQATGGGRDRPEEPARRAVHVLHRRERIERGAQHGPDLHPPQAARAAPAHRAGDRPAPPRGLAACRASGSTRRCCRRSASAGSSRRRCTSTRFRTPICRRSTTGRRSCTTGCGSCPACRT